MEQIITILDAANALGVSKTTITRTVEALGLKLNKSGNRYVLTADQFDMIRQDLIQREIERQKMQNRPVMQTQNVAEPSEEPYSAQADSTEADEGQGSDDQPAAESIAVDGTIGAVIETLHEQLNVKDEQLKNRDEELKNKDVEINRLIDNIDKLYKLIEKEKAEKENVTNQLLQLQQQNAFYQQLQITEKAEMKQTSAMPRQDNPIEEEEPPKKKKKGFFGLFGK